MKKPKTLLSAAMTAFLSFGTMSPVLADQIYIDVSDSNPDYEGIKFCQETGIMTGKGEGTKVFDPEGTLSRGEMVTILYRMSGQPEVLSAGFAEVPADSFYKKASTWAKENGIMTGNLHEDGSFTFDGQNSVTKEQVCLILQRYAKQFLGNLEKTSASLPDWLKEASLWAQEGVKWAIENHLIDLDDGAIDITMPSDRGWIATIIKNFLAPFFGYADGSTDSNLNDFTDSGITDLPAGTEDFVDSALPTTQTDWEVRLLLNQSDDEEKEDQKFKDVSHNGSIEEIIFKRNGTMLCTFKNGETGSGTYTIYDSEKGADLPNVGTAYTSYLRIDNFVTPEKTYDKFEGIILVNRRYMPSRLVQFSIVPNGYDSPMGLFSKDYILNY